MFQVVRLQSEWDIWGVMAFEDSGMEISDVVEMINGEESDEILFDVDLDGEPVELEAELYTFKGDVDSDFISFFNSIQSMDEDRCRDLKYFFVSQGGKNVTGN